MKNFMNIYSKLILLAVFCLSSSVLIGQFDERDVLLKKAQKFTFQRMYEKADQVYQELLDKYPNDEEVIEKTITNLIRMSEFFKAEKIRSEKRPFLSEIVFISLGVTIKLADNRIDDAWKDTRYYLDANAGKINDHKALAFIFERYRQYEKAIEILLSARKTANDEFLYTKELAYNFERIKDNRNAVIEYLKFLKDNKKYTNYVYNRLKSILEENPEQISTVAGIAEQSKDPNIREVYGLCLAFLGKIEEAFEVYETLENSKLVEFAERQFKAGNLDVALKAYESILEDFNKPNQKADAKIEIARIYLKLAKFNKAEKLLLEIYNDKDLQKGKYKYKTDANLVSRELLADISLKRDKDEEQFLSFMEEAKEFAFNKKIRQELEYKIIHYQIMMENYQLAQEKLKQQLKNEEYGTDIYKMGYFYSYLIALMQGESIADSLLGEILINLPENEYTNDVLSLSVLGVDLDKDNKKILYESFRKKNLFQVSEAIEMLKILHENTGNENLLLLAKLWAMESGLYEKAYDLSHFAFQDSLYQDYAQLNLTRMTANDSVRIQLATDFLKANNNSVFAPSFRQIIRK